jgi:PAS domain S-box-containing protein
MMVVQDYEKDNRYTQDDVDFLFSIGGDVAKVVERKQAEEKIRESEKRYRSLFEDSPISLWEEDFSAVKKKVDSWKKKGITNFNQYLEQHPEESAECAKLVRILDVNRATMDLLRAKNKEDLLKNLSPILTEETADEFNQELVQIAEGKNHFEWEGKNRTLSGEQINVQLSWSVLPGYEKDLSKVLVSIVDITQRKKSELEMQHLIQELRKLGELEKDNRILAEALAKNAVTINRTLQADKILDAIIENLGAVIPYDTASVMLIKNDGAKIVRSKGFKEKGLEEWVQLRTFFLNEYPNLDTVYQTGNYVLVSQVDKNPDWRPNKEMDWVQSAINAPLKEGEKVIGFLNVDSSIPGYYSKSHAEHLMLFTEQVATALKNAKLYEETQKRINRMQAMTQIDQAINSSLDLNISLEIILMQAKEQLRADAANILLVDEINQSLVFSKARGFKTDVINKTNLRLGTGLPSAAVMERTVVQIPDLQTAEESYFRNALTEQEGFRSYYCAPLVTKGQLKGVIEIYFKQPFQADQEWLEFLGTLAQQSAIAINNAELLNSLQAGQFELVNAYENALQGWVQTYEEQLGGKDEFKRLKEFSRQLAEKTGMNQTDLANFKRGVLIHDIGMTSIPTAIIHKTEKLTETERQTIQAHPTNARFILSKSKYLANIMDIPCHHHERWDGSGYPQELMGDSIPLAARIFAVADTWVALTSDRPYRKAWSKGKARNHIRTQSGKHFDAQVVETFLELVN